MEKPTPQEHDLALPNEGSGETSRKFRGIRLRKWGSWVSEIRMPKCRAKLWLGSYKTPEQAARAYDAAAYYLQRPATHFNFPDSVSLIPPLSNSHSPKQIKDAAAKYALGELTSTSSLPSLHKNSEQQPALVSPLQSTSVSEMEIPNDKEALLKFLLAGTDGAEGLNLDKLQPINDVPAPASSDHEALWKSLLAGTDGAEGLNFDNLRPINEVPAPAPASDLLPTPHVSYNSDPTQLWNLGED